MDWYGKEHLQPAYTKKLMKKWHAPAGNTAARYYTTFPTLYPSYLPNDHYIVKYDEELYPKHRDYSTFKSAPEKLKPTHVVEWEDGYGPCNVCDECIAINDLNRQQRILYYERLKEWMENGTSMLDGDK